MICHFMTFKRHNFSSTILNNNSNLTLLLTYCLQLVAIIGVTAVTELINKKNLNFKLQNERNSYDGCTIVSGKKTQVKLQTLFSLFYF